MSEVSQPRRAENGDRANAAGAAELRAEGSAQCSAVQCGLAGAMFRATALRAGRCDRPEAATESGECAMESRMRCEASPARRQALRGSATSGTAGSAGGAGGARGGSLSALPATQRPERRRAARTARNKSPAPLACCYSRTRHCMHRVRMTGPPSTSPRTLQSARRPAASTNTLPHPRRTPHCIPRPPAPTAREMLARPGRVRKASKPPCVVVFITMARMLQHCIVAVYSVQCTYTVYSTSSTSSSQRG